MKLVIDIDEKMYEDCKIRDTLHYSLYSFSSMIVNGTPLTEWLNSFDTNSATKCFEAVNILKEQIKRSEVQE